jgi:hypothetical protein
MRHWVMRATLQSPDTGRGLPPQANRPPGIDGKLGLPYRRPLQTPGQLTLTMPRNHCDGPKIQAVRAKRLAVFPQCEECRTLWLPFDPERWQAHWVDDGPDEKLVFYCSGVL